jgi:ATP-binding cassette, subfamily B, multidrug efflux pump
MQTDDNVNITDKKNFDFNLMKRLFAYARPFRFLLAVSLFLMIMITLLQLARPVLIGKAIDFFINGYKTPFSISAEKTKDSISFDGLNLIKEDKVNKLQRKALIVYAGDKYYFFKELNDIDIKKLDAYKFQKTITRKNILNVTIGGRNYSGKLLSENDLKILRMHDFNGILIASLLFLGILILGFGCTYLQTLILQITGQKIIFNMRHEVFEHILKLPFKFFDTNPVGRLVTRMTNDTETINEMYTSVLVNLTKNIFLMIGIVIMMLVINPLLTLLIFSIFPVVIISIAVFRHFARDNFRKMRKAIAALNSFLSEHISGMKIIQIFNIEEKKYKEFDTVSSQLKTRYMKEIRLFSIFRPLMFFTYILTVCMVVLFGGNSVLTGAITFGTLFMFFYYVNQFFEPVQEIAEQFNVMQSTMASSERIFSLLDEKTEVTNGTDEVKLEKVQGKIEFKNVWFAYNDEDWVLKNVSFTINPGETIAIVGFTGSGKTTIISLICRFYEIQKGEILIDGINIKDIDIDSLRKNVGLVMQDVFMFTGDIASNIRLKEESITREQVIEAANFVNAATFIEKYPAKYHELVTERGSTLSTGQRQLLSFARTIAFNPRILVLDEATSNIDTETEILIQEALKNITSQRTSIVIAHRLSTIQHSDSIIVLHKGEIREIGKHKELIEKKGMYYNLYKLNYGLDITT